ncbi:MAG: hypothetical protein AAGI28_14075 [Pseudomonadota bacterium]
MNIRFTQTAPFTLSSDLDLGGSLAFPLRRQATADIEIAQGPVPDALPCEPFDTGFYVNGDQVLLQLDRKHAFLIEGGERVTYRPGPNATAFLTGTVIGILCYQRRLLPLHASAVVKAGRVHAFTGPPGSGKSSMALALANSECAFFTDDILAINSNHGDHIQCYAIQRLAKLWSDSLDKLKAEQVGEAYCRNGKVKHLAKVDRPEAAVGARQGELASLSLVVAQSCKSTVFEELRGSDAMRLLVGSIYRPQFGEQICGKAWMFEQLCRVARHISVHRLTRPTGWEALPETTKHVTQHLISCASQSH